MNTTTQRKPFELKRTHRIRAIGRLAMTALLAGLCGSAAAQCANVIINSPEPQPLSYFGDGLAVSDNWLFAGCVLHTSPTVYHAGAVYVYQKAGFGWQLTQRIDPVSPQSNSSYSQNVATDGDWLAITNNFFSTPDVALIGEVEIYHRVGGAWSPFQRLYAPVPDQIHYSHFGDSVSIRGSRMAIGYRGDNGDGYTGAAFVYRFNGAAWVLEQRIADPAGNPISAFGESVSIEGDYLMVSAPTAPAATGYPGIVYIYRWTGSSWALATAMNGNPNFGGMGVQIRTHNGTFLALNSQAGEMRVMQVAGGGFGSVEVIHAAAGQGLRSVDLSADGQTIAAGVTEENMPGRVNTWNRTVSGWVMGSTFLSDGSATSSNFPNLVAINADHLAVGLPYATVADQGAAGAVQWVPLPLALGSSCENPLAAGPGTFQGCTSAGAADSAQTCAPVSSARAVWYEFDPPCPGIYMIDTVGSTFDTVLSVYSSCPAESSIMLACNDDGPGLGLASRVQVRVTQPVLIRIGGYQTDEGSYHLNISQSIGSANDTCADAINVPDTGLRFCTSTATSDGIHDIACTSGNTMYNDVWFSYTPSCSGLFEFTACDADFDSVMALYVGGCEGVNHGPIACNDDNAFCGVHAQIDAQLIAGTPYLLRVGGYYPSSAGSGYLYVSGLSNCPADFNNDGGIDGSDVQVFFDAWESGSFAADVNCDGGVDGADVQVFFAAWENGGC